MKILIPAFLLTLLSLSACASVIAFGEGTVNSIFKERKEAVVLFLDEGTKESRKVFEKAAKRDESQRIYTIVDGEANPDHFKRFSEYLGVDIASTPILILLRQGTNKYLASPQDLTEEGVLQFIARVDNGEIKKHLKSAPVPHPNDGPVLTLVGSNFREVVFSDEREILVKFYAPWCGHCKKIAPQYIAAAEAMSKNKNIVLAEFDGSANEIEGVDISGYPTLLWYGKDKREEPLKFNGERDKAGIIAWLRDHTENDWVKLDGQEEL